MRYNEDMHTEQPISDRGPIVGQMTCQECGKVFTKYRYRDSEVFEEFLQYHLERHRIDRILSER